MRQRTPLSFRSSPHEKIVCSDGFESGFLLEEAKDFGVGAFSLSFSLFPDSVKGASLDPADLDGSGDTSGGVGLDVEVFSVVLGDVVLEPGSRPTVSSRSTVLDINLI